MATTPDLVLARAREHMAKNASFMSGLRRGVSWTGSQIGRGAGAAVRGIARPIVRSRQSRQLAESSQSLRRARQGLANTLHRLGVKPAEVGGVGGGIKPTIPRMNLGLKKKLMVGGGLLAAGATMAGGASAAKTRAQQPLAPPELVPPGY